MRPPFTRIGNISIGHMPDSYMSVAGHRIFNQTYAYFRFDLNFLQIERMISMNEISSFLEY